MRPCPSGRFQEKDLLNVAPWTHYIDCMHVRAGRLIALAEAWRP